MTEYTGWDDYVNRKRTNEHLKQTKEEWKDAVNDYFGITIPPEDKPTAAHMKQIEFQISKLRNDIYTIHTRINQITDCGHGKLRKQLTPLVEGNVLGRIEALEQWREKIADITQLDKRVWELENNMKVYHEPMMECWNNKHHERILRLEEWKQNIIRKNNEWFNRVYEENKIIDKKVWDEIKYYTSKIDHYSWPRVDSFGDLRACVYKLKEHIKEVDPEFCPND